MRWPDIFFRTKKRPEEPSPAPAFKSSTNPKPQSSPTAPKTAAIPLKPAAASPEVEPPAASSLLATPDTAVEQAMVEADPVRVLSLSGNLRLSKRTREPNSTTGPILIKSETDEPKSGPETTSEPPAVEPAPANPAPPPEPAPALPTAAEPSDNEDSFSFLMSPEAGTSPESTPPRSISVTGGRRKAKLTDVARVVVPTSHDEPESSPTIFPAAFPVAVPAGSLLPMTETESPKEPAAPTSKPPDSPPAEKPPEPSPTASTPAEDHKHDVPPSPEKPQSDPGPQKPEPAAGHVPLEHLSPPIGSQEKREFLLTNGERIFGRVLSETTDAFYIEHGTLGVLTLLRSQIAQRPVEIILINGDRIVGDIMAETPDTLYVRHASLGMLTVPRAQRSTRVVEAILKDGDRILGEVLAETDNFTVIRSATLGTIAVPHDKVAMLNRKIEQIELKPLAPELKDKA